jgi:AMP deaminase
MQSLANLILTFRTLQNCEWRISIYGRSPDEWDKLAKWVINHKLYSHNVRWLVQVPRLYNVYKASGQVDNFEKIIRSEFTCPFFIAFDLTLTCLL